MGIPFAAGIRFLLDSHQSFVRQSNGPVALRIRNVDTTGQAFQELGFQLAPSGQSGFSDIPINPPPQVTEATSRDIGLAGGKLMFGARKFVISHSFVLAQMKELLLTDPYQVFRRTAVIGIFYDGRLFSIEQLLHEDAGGEIINWIVAGNAQETGVTVT